MQDTSTLKHDDTVTGAIIFGTVSSHVLVLLNYRQWWKAPGIKHLDPAIVASNSLFGAIQQVDSANLFHHHTEGQGSELCGLFDDLT